MDGEYPPPEINNRALRRGLFKASDSPDFW